MIPALYNAFVCSPYHGLGSFSGVLCSDQNIILDTSVANSAIVTLSFGRNESLMLPSRCNPIFPSSQDNCINAFISSDSLSVSLNVQALVLSGSAANAFKSNILENFAISFLLSGHMRLALHILVTVVMFILRPNTYASTSSCEMLHVIDFMTTPTSFMKSNVLSMVGFAVFSSALLCVVSPHFLS